MSENYFDHDEEDVLHDAFLMIVCERTDYENIERTLDYWKQNADLLE